MNDFRPLMAIVCANSLTVMGLKQLLQSVMPSIEVESYATVSDLRDDKPERFVHFFVEISAFISDRQFFAERQHRTIVLTTSPEHSAQLSGYHCLCVNVDEQHLARNLLLLIRQGHPNGHTMMSGKGHPMPPGTGHSILRVLAIPCLRVPVIPCRQLATAMRSRPAR